METLKQQVQALSMEEWGEFFGWVVGDEKARREAMPAVEQAEDALITQLRDAGTIPTPATSTTAEDGTVAETAPWVDPKGDPTKSYRRGDLVHHQGQDWESVHPGLNEEEPGKGKKWALYEPPTPEPAPEDVDGQDAEPEPQEQPAENVTNDTAQPGKKTPPGQAKKGK